MTEWQTATIITAKLVYRSILLLGALTIILGTFGCGHTLTVHGEPEDQQTLHEAFEFFLERVQTRLYTYPIGDQMYPLDAYVVAKPRCRGSKDVAACYARGDDYVEVSHGPAGRDLVPGFLHELMHVYRHKVMNLPPDYDHDSAFWDLTLEIIHDWGVRE